VQPALNNYQNSLGSAHLSVNLSLRIALTKCLSPSDCPSVTSQFSAETAEHGIMHTMLYDTSGTSVLMHSAPKWVLNAGGVG